MGELITQPLLLKTEGNSGQFGKVYMKESIYEIAKQAAQNLRGRQTTPEAMLWSALCDRRFRGRKFYRQHPIPFEYHSQKRFFIADFQCYEDKLVVEIDGKTHGYQKNHDDLRTNIINEL